MPPTQKHKAAKQTKWAKNRSRKAMSLLQMIDKLEQYLTYKPCELGMPDDATWPSVCTTWNSNCKIQFLPTMDQDFYPVMKVRRHRVVRKIPCFTGRHIYGILRNESKLYATLHRLCPAKSAAIESNRNTAQKLIADCLFFLAEGCLYSAYENACCESLGFIWQGQYNGSQHRNQCNKPMWETEEQSQES